MDAEITLDDPHTVPTRYWHREPDGRVQCDVCPQACRMHEGERGLCFVRGRVEDQVVLTTYGRAGGFCVDPIERKPLYHFLPGTPVLSFGTPGCNLSCGYCDRWDPTAARQMQRLSEDASPEQIARTAQRLGCRSVAFAHNDPTIFLEYAVDVADACRELGLRTVALSAGYIGPAARAELYAHVDAATIDLKAFSAPVFEAIAGGGPAPVLDTLVHLYHHTDVWLEVSTLLVPGLTDRPEQVDGLSRWLVEELGPDVPLHLSAFHPSHRMIDVRPTPPDSLAVARRIALANGLHHVYTDAELDPESATTFCSGCGRAVIERDGFWIETYDLDAAGHCHGCGEVVPGRFEGPVGRWGGRRLPVRMPVAQPDPADV